jgi:serine phosphatase RsbU (regulator of sigma subunit)
VIKGGGGFCSRNFSFNSANVYLLKSLELGKKKKDQLSIGYTYRDLGGLEFKKGNYEKAIEYLKTSLEIFKSKKKLGGYSSILKSISESYEAIGNTNEALRYYKQAKSLDDSLINTSTIREVAIKEATFNYTKDQELSALKLKDKAAAIELLNNKNELQELVLRKNELESIEKNKSIQLLSQQDSLKSFTIRQSKAKEVIALVESRRQKNIIWSIIMGLLLLTIFSIFMVQRFKISQKQKKIIEKQKTEVEKQKKVVEEKNHEILDSINYAKRIQTAILPQPRVVKEFLKSSFVLYIPKDIVAGDFYWMENIDQTVYIAACDCTGHGVPGAMVSVVCNNALNRALNEYGKRLPSEIFDKTRELVIENFAKSDEDVQDGMDASLAALDVNNRTLLWSGANNPLWIIRKDSNTHEYVLEDIKADKQPIGKGYETRPFTTHQIQLNEGDTIYLFTDGYADQFGGEKNKKMTKAKFRALLLSLTHLPMEKQRTALLEFHDQYRGNEEQVDDICVIGVRV